MVTTCVVSWPCTLSHIQRR